MYTKDESLHSFEISQSMSEVENTRNDISQAKEVMPPLPEPENSGTGRYVVNFEVLQSAVCILNKIKSDLEKVEKTSAVRDVSANSKLDKIIKLYWEKLKVELTAKLTNEEMAILDNLETNSEWHKEDNLAILKVAVRGSEINEQTYHWKLDSNPMEDVLKDLDKQSCSEMSKKSKSGGDLKEEQPLKAEPKIESYLEKPIITPETELLMQFSIEEILGLIYAAISDINIKVFKDEYRVLCPESFDEKEFEKRYQDDCQHRLVTLLGIIQRILKENPCKLGIRIQLLTDNFQLVYPGIIAVQDLEAHMARCFRDALDSLLKRYKKERPNSYWEALLGEILLKRDKDFNAYLKSGTGNKDPLLLTEIKQKLAQGNISFDARTEFLVLRFWSELNNTYSDFTAHPEEWVRKLVSIFLRGNKDQWLKKLEQYFLKINFSFSQEDKNKIIQLEKIVTFYLNYKKYKVLIFHNYLLYPEQKNCFVLDALKLVDGLLNSYFENWINPSSFGADAKQNLLSSIARFNELLEVYKKSEPSIKKDQKNYENINNFVNDFFRNWSDGPEKKIKFETIESNLFKKAIQFSDQELSILFPIQGLTDATFKDQIQLWCDKNKNANSSLLFNIGFLRLLNNFKFFKLLNTVNFALPQWEKLFKIKAFTDLLCKVSVLELFNQTFFIEHLENPQFLSCLEDANFLTIFNHPGFMDLLNRKEFCVLLSNSNFCDLLKNSNFRDCLLKLHSKLEGWFFLLLKNPSFLKSLPEQSEQKVFLDKKMAVALFHNALEIFSCEMPDVEKPQEPVYDFEPIYLSEDILNRVLLYSIYIPYSEWTETFFNTLIYIYDFYEGKFLRDYLSVENGVNVSFYTKSLLQQIQYRMDRYCLYRLSNHSHFTSLYKDSEDLPQPVLPKEIYLPVPYKEIPDVVNVKAHLALIEPVEKTKYLNEHKKFITQLKQLTEMIELLQDSFDRDLGNIENIFTKKERNLHDEFIKDSKGILYNHPDAIRLKHQYEKSLNCLREECSQYLTQIHQQAAKSALEIVDIFLELIQKSQIRLTDHEHLAQFLGAILKLSEKETSSQKTLENRIKDTLKNNSSIFLKAFKLLDIDYQEILESLQENISIWQSKSNLKKPKFDLQGAASFTQKSPEKIQEFINTPKKFIDLMEQLEVSQRIAIINKIHKHIASLFTPQGYEECNIVEEKIYIDPSLPEAEQEELENELLQARVNRIYASGLKKREFMIKSKELLDELNFHLVNWFSDEDLSTLKQKYPHLFVTQDNEYPAISYQADFFAQPGPGNNKRGSDDPEEPSPLKKQKR